MPVVIRKRGEFKGDFPRKREFIENVRECIYRAQELFPGFTLTPMQLPIVFVRRGQTAGMAKWKRLPGHGVIYNVEFNVDAIEKDWDDMVGDTIPHEIAHIVDRFINGKSSSHGKPWQIIARRLGCSAKRTHSIPTERARKRRKHRYVAECGTEVWVTTNMHNKLQNGSRRRIRATHGALRAEHCMWEEKMVG